MMQSASAGPVIAKESKQTRVVTVRILRTYWGPSVMILKPEG